MTVSRREFVRTLGWTGAATLGAGRLVAARGHEALGARWSSAAIDPRIISLDSNENPHGPGARALEAIRAAFSSAHRYPYDEADALTSAIARLHAVREGNVTIGCGSAEILRMTMQAFTSPTKPLVTIAPTFETPAEYAGTFGVPVTAVRVDASLRIDLATMADKARGAGVVYLCNPNNPTGTVLPASAITTFVGRLAVESPQTVVLVDEAYHDYVDDPAYRTSIPLIARYKNLVVSRTFSKVYGMAGLRCGYGVAHTDTLSKMMRYKLETSVNQLAIAAALNVLADADHLDRERKLNREAKDYTRGVFESAGYRVVPSEANFVFVDVMQDARAFRDGCRRLGVLVGRAFPPLTTYARISIGTMDEMQRAGDVFTSVLRSATAPPRGAS